jgi:amino acid transporter
MSANLTPTSPEANTDAAKTPAHRPRLSELAATAICGNDITSSCLYVSALAILYAGVWAPVALLLVGGMLYLFRSIYGEVVGALPLNGGAYNALLNTTSKFRASMAACLTILSYMATAVISATVAMHYVAVLWPSWPVIPMTVVLLAIFTGLTILGIAESAMVAIGIFVFHIFTLTCLVAAGGWYVITHGLATLSLNIHTPTPGGFAAAIFFGFCVSLLGISGFESSANFVEEQAPGVFPKTLRNMWLAVMVFNPLIALLALCVLPLGEIASHDEAAMLANMGTVTSGHWMATWISVNAVLVLSGAVLTSFVGVNGLVGRMTLDRCLPQLLLKKNRRGTTHRITIAFFILSVSVLLITKGDWRALAGVYTISFLAVMALFGGGNLLLKIKRAALPRPVRASWISVLVAISAVVIGLLGNARLNPTFLIVFLQYFIPTALVVIVMLERIVILKAIMFALARISAFFSRPPSGLTWLIRETIQEIVDQQMVFFTRGDNLANLNRAILYVLKNEHTKRIKVVTVVQDPSQCPGNLKDNLAVLDEIYPEMDIEFVVITDKFSPDLITELSKKWEIPTNFMFIGSPAGKLPYDLADLRGVRLIV